MHERTIEYRDEQEIDIATLNSNLSRYVRESNRNRIGFIVRVHGKEAVMILPLAPVQLTRRARGAWAGPASAVKPRTVRRPYHLNHG